MGFEMVEMGEELIGQEAFFKLVGGSDAKVTRQAGVSVITRLLAVQVRDACRVKPTRIDRGTMSMIHAVDDFYGVRGIGRERFTRPEGTEANPAGEIFDISGIPQDVLLQARTDLDGIVAPFEEKGVVGRLLAIAAREDYAALVSRRVVATKLQVIGF